MSRIGKKPIKVPTGVEVQVDGPTVRVKGPKGALGRDLPAKVLVNIDGDTVNVAAVDESREARALHGLARMLIANMVTGVSQGFERSLDIIGVGYKAEMAGNTAVLSLGYSHPVRYELPQGVEARVEKGWITLSSSDKELLGHVCADLRRYRPPEPYKGKGVKFTTETVRRKAGKAGSK